MSIDRTIEGGPAGNRADGGAEAMEVRQGHAARPDPGRDGRPGGGDGPGRPPGFARRRSIRFSDCDPAAIVFYPQYFVMLNGLVEDWISDVRDGLGIGYRRLILERRIGLPTVRLEADFRAVSRMGDEVVLGLDVEHLGSRSIRLALACHDAERGEPRMTMRQVLVTTSLDTHRAIEIPVDLRAAIERHGTRPRRAAGPLGG